MRWYRYPPVRRFGSPSVRSASRSVRTSDARTHPSERLLGLPHANGQGLGAVVAERFGQALVDPRRQDLDRHRLGATDVPQVLVPQDVRGLGDHLRQHVEVHDHAALVEAFALRDHLDAVVVRVALVLRRGLVGHPVERAERRHGADLVHQYLSATCIRPSSPRSSASYASPARSNATSWVASSLSGSSVIRRSAARRRRSTVHRPASRAGIVETWVLLIARRRRWNAPPSGNGTSFVPYQLQTSTSPSCARSSSAAVRASGLPVASTTRGTPAREVLDSTSS